MKILITGATGFIGRNLAIALRDHGHEVRALVRPASVAQLPKGITPIQDDLAHPTQLSDTLQDTQTVYHLAAVRDQWGVPYQVYRQVNVEGTRALLQAAAAGDVRRFIYCSSVGVAEYPGKLDADETLPHHWERSKHNYHHTKALAEDLTLEYAREKQLATTVVRPCITYGPGDTWGMIPRMAAMLARGRYVMAGAGRNHIHLAYIDDVVQGLLLAGECEQAIGQPYILVGPAPIRMADLVARLCTVLQVAPPRWRLPAAPLWLAGALLEVVYTIKNRLGIKALGQVPFLTRSKVDTVTLDSAFSAAKARAELGYQPRVDYDEGLQRTVEWCRAHDFL